MIWTRITPRKKITAYYLGVTAFAVWGLAKMVAGGASTALRLMH